MTLTADQSSGTISVGPTPYNVTAEIPSINIGDIRSCLVNVIKQYSNVTYTIKLPSSGEYYWVELTGESRSFQFSSMTQSSGGSTIKSGTATSALTLFAFAYIRVS